MSTFKHGDSMRRKRAPEYGIFLSMLRRCNDPKNKGYKYYGGRGIKVCDAWNHSSMYSFFLATVGRRPSRNHSLDRINNNGNYEPGNVRWATRKQQARNTRSNRVFTINGETHCVEEWAEKYNVGSQAVRLRLRRGVPIKEALTTPMHQRIADRVCHLTPEQRRDRNKLVIWLWKRRHPERLRAHSATGNKKRSAKRLKLLAQANT